MEVDEAKLAGSFIVPIMEARLDRIIKELVGKFKGGKLTPETLVQLRADWLATSRLMGEIETLARN